MNDFSEFADPLSNPMEPDFDFFYEAQRERRIDKFLFKEEVEEAATSPNKTPSYLTEDIITRIENNVPIEMLDAENWCCYKLVKRDGRQTKIPCNVKGIAISGADAKYSFDDVAFTNKKVTGLGFALRTPMVGFDIDDCIIDDKIVDESIVADVKNLSTYCELSPSGTGLHCIFMMDEKPDFIKRSRNGKYELYFNRRFFTVTGNAFKEYSKSIRTVKPEELLDIYKKIDPEFGTEKTHKDERNKKTTPSPRVFDSSKHLEGIGGSDEEVIGRLHNYFKSTLLFDGSWESVQKSNGQRFTSQSEADMCLVHYIAIQTGYNWEQTDRIFCMSELFREKWYEYRGERTYGEMTLKNEFMTSGHANSIPEEYR